MRIATEHPGGFTPDRWIAIGAAIVLLGGIVLESILAGVLLFLVSGAGYDPTVEGRRQVAIGATLWLVVAIPIAVAVLWTCRETFRGQRRGLIGLVLIGTALVVASAVMMSAFIGIVAALLLMFALSRLQGWGSRPI